MASFPTADEHRFAIILGAGAAGIIQGCTFLRNKAFALDEFEILDRNPDFGGVWWKNTYPGAACDIPSHIYSIRWAPNPYWSQKFAPQAEIQEYFKGVALQYGLDKCTTFETEILGATWDESQMLWMVETQSVQTGIKRWWSCHVLVGALGAFTVPKKADITGLDSFKGEEWHTVDWPKDADIKGKTVGIIGTGPSAAQLLPHIYPDVRQLIVYQRSPGHVLPRDNFNISPLTKWCYANVPFVLKIFRGFLLEKNAWIGRNLFVLGGWGQRLVLGMAQKHLHKQIKDEKLREKLESKDVFGCKRPLSLDDYYPVFNNSNVELVTDPVIGLAEHSIVSKQSETGKVEEREVDVLIWGTGYKPVDFGLAVPTRGRTGQLISDKYQPELFSLYGISVDDFPNYFNFLGPNSSSFETSVMDLFELQAEYITQVASHLYDKNVGSYRYAVMPREERVRTWTLSLREGQAKLPPAVPECRSYYKSRIGHVYRYPYRYSGYKALIKKPDFKRDWVTLRNRIGQKQVQILDIC